MTVFLAAILLATMLLAIIFLATILLEIMFLAIISAVLLPSEQSVETVPNEDLRKN